MEIADRLINAIRESGDLRVAAPSLASPCVFFLLNRLYNINLMLNRSDIMDVDEDEVMLSSTHQSQFTRSLMLFVCSCLYCLVKFLPHR